MAGIAVYTNGGSPPFFSTTAYKKIYRYHPPYWIKDVWTFGTPWLWCDGDKDPAWQTPAWRSFISQRLAVPPEMDVWIYGQYQSASGALDLQFQIKNIAAVALTGKMHAVLTEDGIAWKAPNGQAVHNHVPRIWWPDQYGRAVSLASGETARISASWTIDKAWNADNLKVVAFVQDTVQQSDFTCAVYQGAVQELRKLQTGLPAGQIETVRDFRLLQNAPNPFNPSTEISFQTPDRDRVRVSIFDMNGKMLGTLFEGEMPEGRHSMAWDGKDENGRPAPSGVYILMVQAGPSIQGLKMTLMK